MARLLTAFFALIFAGSCSLPGPGRARRPAYTGFGQGSQAADTARQEAYEDFLDELYANLKQILESCGRYTDCFLREARRHIFDHACGASVHRMDGFESLADCDRISLAFADAMAADEGKARTRLRSDD